MRTTIGILLLMSYLLSAVSCGKAEQQSSNLDFNSGSADDMNVSFTFFPTPSRWIDYNIEIKNDTLVYFSHYNPFREKDEKDTETERTVRLLTPEEVAIARNLVKAAEKDMPYIVVGDWDYEVTVNGKVVLSATLWQLDGTPQSLRQLFEWLLMLCPHEINLDVVLALDSLKEETNIMY